VFFAAIGIPAVTCVSLYRGALAARSSRRSATTTAVLAGIVFGGWVTASALLANSGVYHPVSLSAMPWFVMAFTGALLFALAATWVPAVSRALAAPGTVARLIAPHAPRVAGVAFLISFALGHLPAAFALPAGLGDMAVGLSAPFVARRLARGDGRRGAVWFNILGLLDLVVALSMGALTGIGPQQILHVAPASEALSMLPLALIPTTAVPLLMALHIVSLRRLAAAPSSTQATSGFGSAPVADGYLASQPSTTS
jgi:hypothetical protein